MGQDSHIPHHLVGVAGVGAGAEVEFHGFVELGIGQLLEQVDGLPGGVSLVGRDFFGDAGVAAAVLGHSVLIPFHGDAHAAGGAGNDGHSLFYGVGVEVFELGFGDFAQGVLADSAGAALAEVAGALFDAGGPA